MALGRLPTALIAVVFGMAFGLALGPGAARAQTAESFVETFRRACLAHLPDFAGSPAAFESLGFDGSDGRFARDADGERMRAQVYERTVDEGRGCVLAAEVPADAPVVPRIESLVSELTGDAFMRREAERDGKRIDAFIWPSGQWQVLLVVLPDVSGMRALNVTVGGAPR